MSTQTRRPPASTFALHGVVLAIAIAGGCAHADKAESVETAHPHLPQTTPDAAGMPRISTNPTHPLVVDSPQELLRPAGGRRLQQALQEAGFLTEQAGQPLDETSMEAIRRFQWEVGLAATGFPDAETLRRLGLDPDEIYRERIEARQVDVAKRQQELNQPRDAGGGK